MDGKIPLPAGKGIVVRLDRIPKKTREKPKFKGEGTKVVCDIPFAVDDRNYLDHFDRAIWLTLTDRIRAASGDYKSTDSYRFVEKGLAYLMEGKTPEEKAAILAPYDNQYLSMLSPELVQPLLHHYVIFMKEHHTDDQGRVWQDPKEVRTMEEQEWELDRRRVPEEEAAKHKQAVSKPIGLPKPKAATPEQAPLAEPSKEEQKPEPPHRPEPLTLAKVQEEMRGFVGAEPFKSMAKKFLALKGKDRIGAMEEQDQRHLWALLRIEEHHIKGGRPAELVDEHLKLRGRPVIELDPADSILLLTSLDKTATSGVSF